MLLVHASKLRHILIPSNSPPLQFILCDVIQFPVVMLLYKNCPPPTSMINPPKAPPAQLNFSGSFGVLGRTVTTGIVHTTRGDTVGEVHDGQAAGSSSRLILSGTQTLATAQSTGYGCYTHSCTDKHVTQKKRLNYESTDTEFTNIHTSTLSINTMVHTDEKILKHKQILRRMPKESQAQTDMQVCRHTIE